MKKEKGITLIALVITIIVLLILAGITIATLTGDNGLLTKSKSAVNKYSEGEIEEQIKLAYAEWQTTQLVSSAEDPAAFMQGRLRIALKDYELTVTGAFKITLTGGKEIYFNAETGKISDIELEVLPIIAAGETASIKSKAKFISGDYTAVIPAGYTVSSTANSIENGLVVMKAENEWVWIPVSSVELAEMYMKDKTGWTMTGTGGETGIEAVITKYRTTGTQKRVNPGDISGLREPDVLGSIYDKNEDKWRAAGFSSYLDMAINLRDDYKNMIESIKKYGGFYIGRYELSNAGTQKNQPSLTSTSWHNLYSKCKTLGSDTVESRMMWGCTWEQICKFINQHGDKVSLTDSSTYGNYSNSQTPATTGNYEQGVKKNTGSNEAWKVNNIYDIAGNCYEWTQEAYSNWKRAYRGGCYADNGKEYPVTKINHFDMGHISDSKLTTRPVLYLK